MDIAFHYPSELMSLLIDTISRLFRSKMDVLLFFKGAGVNDSRIYELSNRVKQDRSRITKYEICRTVLEHLNEKGELTLRERREILKRVTEFEDFSTCWPNDQLKSKGFVAEIRRVVDVKDSFTSIDQEREKEKKKHQADHQEKFALLQKKRMVLSEVKSDLYSLFGESNSWTEGRSWRVS